MLRSSPLAVVVVVIVIVLLMLVLLLLLSSSPPSSTLSSSLCQAGPIDRPINLSRLDPSSPMAVASMTTALALALLGAALGQDLPVRQPQQVGWTPIERRDDSLCSIVDGVVFLVLILP